MARSSYARRQAKWQAALARAAASGDMTLYAQILDNPPRPDWEIESEGRGLPQPRWKRSNE